MHGAERFVRTIADSIEYASNLTVVLVVPGLNWLTKAGKFLKKLLVYKDVEVSVKATERRVEFDKSLGLWDGLKRPKTATSQGITLTYTYGKKSIGGTDFPTENITATAGGLTLDQGTTVHDLAGYVIQKISPDFDGDGNPEITSISRDFSTRTTTVINPDSGTTISTDYADGQSKSTTGTATVPLYFNYSTHNEQGGGRLSFHGAAANGPWNKSYKNLAGRTLRSTFDNGSTEVALQTNTYDNSDRLIPSFDADNVSQLTAYNAKGEAYRQAVDLNQNGQIDNADRITDTLQDVVADSPIGAAIRSRSIIYDLSNSPVTLSVSYQSPDGMTTFKGALGLNVLSKSVRASHLDRSDGAWTDTTTAPDGTKTILVYQNWLPVSQSHLDTENNIIDSNSSSQDALRRTVAQTYSRTDSVAVTRTAYHPTNGLATSVTDSVTAGVDRVISFGYDSMGRRAVVTFPGERYSYTSYWPSGREKATWGSQTNTTVTLYSPKGQPTELRTFRSANLALSPDESTENYDATTWHYNARNQLERKEYADSKGSDYTYTPAGRIKTRRWSRGNWTRYDYDTAGNLKATLYFTPTTTESEMIAAAVGNDADTPDTFIICDKLGRPDLITQNNQSLIDYAYDPTTLALDTETISYDLDHDGTADFTRVIDRSQDALGRDTGFQLKNGTTIENQGIYTYGSADGRLNTVTGMGAGASAQTFIYGYTPNSNLIHTVTGPIHTVTNIWEATRDVLDVKQNKVGINDISKYDYIVNQIGQGEGVAASSDVLSALPTWEWAYDSLGQLTRADSSVDTSDRSYEYDAIGNRKKSSDSLALPATDNYTSNSLNQYTAVQSGGTSVSPGYDQDGNMNAGKLPAGPSANGTLVWDAENRLIQVKNAAGTTIEANTFDSQNRKISTTVNGVTTLYIYNIWNCIAEYSGNGGVLPILDKIRLWGVDLSGSMQGGGGVGGLLSETHISNSQSLIYYPLYDGNGNISEYLDANGAIACHLEYDPFGNTLADTDMSSQFAYRFSTKPLDHKTGLYYYGHRYYDPLTGRWLSRDPKGESGGVAILAMCKNDCVNSFDVLGLEAEQQNAALQCPEGWTKDSDPGAPPYTGPYYTAESMIGAFGFFDTDYLWGRTKFSDFAWEDTGFTAQSNCGKEHTFNASISMSSSHSVNVGGNKNVLGEMLELTFGYSYSWGEGKGIENGTNVGPTPCRQYFGRFLVLTGQKNWQKKTTDDRAGKTTISDWHDFYQFGDGKIYFKHPGWLICSRKCEEADKK